MNKPRLLLVCLVAVVCGAAILSGQESTSPALVSVAKNSRPTGVIVYPRGDPLVQRTAEKLVRYLEEQTGAILPALREDEFKPTGKDLAVIVLDSTPDHRLAEVFGVPIRLSAEHADAYRIKVTTARRWLGKPTELYDLRTDPAENTNVAAGNPGIVRKMEAIFAAEHTPHPDWIKRPDRAPKQSKQPPKS